VQLKIVAHCGPASSSEAIAADRLLGRTDSFCCEWFALLAWCELVALGEHAMQKTAIHGIWKNTCLQACLLLSVFVVSSYPAIAKHHFRHGDRTTSSHSRITCETVRTYVAQVGLEQAKAMAQAAGMTEAEEREAAQCLEKKI
jgi:hypothetical protein